VKSHLNKHSKIEKKKKERKGPFPWGATALCALSDNDLPSLMVWFSLLLYDRDALSDHAYVFLFAGLHLEAGLPTQEERQRNEE